MEVDAHAIGIRETDDLDGAAGMDRGRLRKVDFDSTPLIFQQNGVWINDSCVATHADAMAEGREVFAIEVADGIERAGFGRRLKKLHAAACGNPDARRETTAFNEHPFGNAYDAHFRVEKAGLIPSGLGNGHIDRPSPAGEREPDAPRGVWVLILDDAVDLNPGAVLFRLWKVGGGCREGRRKLDAPRTGVDAHYLEAEAGRTLGRIVAAHFAGIDDDCLAGLNTRAPGADGNHGNSGFILHPEAIARIVGISDDTNEVHRCRGRQIP